VQHDADDGGVATGFPRLPRAPVGLTLPRELCRDDPAPQSREADL